MKITFTPIKDLIPEKYYPKPASSFIPKWYEESCLFKSTASIPFSSNNCLLSSALMGSLVVYTLVQFWLMVFCLMVWPFLSGNLIKFIKQKNSNSGR